MVKGNLTFCALLFWSAEGGGAEFELGITLGPAQITPNAAHFIDSSWRV